MDTGISENVIVSSDHAVTHPSASIIKVVCSLRISYIADRYYPYVSYLHNIRKMTRCIVQITCLK
jgi:hypothetical protein